MKTSIRQSVFESNSSSVHSIVYAKDGLEPSKLQTDKDGYIHVEMGHFGKEYAIYNTQYSKLSYLVTLAFVGSKYRYDYDDYDDYEKKVHVDTKRLREVSTNFQYIEDYVIEYAGCKGIIVDGCAGQAFIDHQSLPHCDEIDIVDVYNEDSVIQFIFDKNISLKTTCD